MIAARALAATALFAAVATAQQPIVTTVLNNGPTSTRYDMVILGDGYQAQEQGHFNSDVNTYLTGLFQKAPYSGFSTYFNVHTVFRASQDSGATHPDVVPPIYRNTAYGASYNTGGTDRCLYIQNTSLALADAALAPANETRVLVMVNDTRYGGCAGQFAVSYNGASMVEVQSHEMGHAVAGLADEYDYPNGNYTGPEPGEINVTADGIGQKWSHWWGTESVGAFQGARYFQTGIWRPRNDCLMRTLGITLCPVCREQITRTVNSVVHTIEAPQPPTTSVTVVRPAQQAFSFTNLVPPANNPLITWKLDGTPIAGQTGNSYLLPSSTTPIGSHILRVELLDQTTQVRNDPAHTLLEAHNWTVVVADPSAANLRLFGQGPPVFVPAGNEFDITVTVVNDGPAAAGNFVVEHFLSIDVLLQTTDSYLGSSAIANLGVGQQTIVTRRVRVPASTTQRPYNLIGTVDRPNTVVETLETDNNTISTVVVQPGGCTPVLEYRDDLLYPRDHAAVSLAGGGTVLPTVVARCAAPGTFYLVAWGCSGTSPGTTLQPGLTVPLNADTCTLAGLDNTNGSVLQLFLGALDQNGLGLATVAWPPGLPFQPLQSNFAAVLMDPSPAFVATTNAVGFELQ